MSKHELRIPTLEPYAYINIEFEGTAEEALAEYKRITALVKGEPEGFGLTDKEFNAVIDELLTKGSITGDPGMLEQMTKEQSSTIQSIKRSLKRTQ
jgi:hypothetical protein